MTYTEQLKDPRWREYSNKLIVARGCCCQECQRTIGAESAEEAVASLEVHHITYLRGRLAWDYPEDLVLVLCRECHLNRQIHDEEARAEFSRVCGHLSSWEVYSLSKALRLLADKGLYAEKRFDAFEAIKSASR